MWLGAAGWEPPLQLLQVRAALPNMWGLMAALRLWEEEVVAVLAIAFLDRQNALRGFEDEAEGNASEDKDSPLDMYMADRYAWLPDTDVLTDPESSRIRDLPFGSPVSDWL